MKGHLNDCVGVRYIYAKLEEEIELLKPLLAGCIPPGVIPPQI